MGIAATLRSIVRHIGFFGNKGSLFYTRVKYLTAKTMHLMMSEDQYARWFYKLYMKKKLNLENPQTVGDKMWWLKLHNKNPLMHLCSDKVAVRDYVTKHGYASTLMPLIDVLNRVDELDLTKYTEEVIVKCSHNSGGHLFYDPAHPISMESLESGKKVLSYLLKQDASILSLEWNYKGIPPKLLVEKVVRDRRGNIPKDYKIWCFNGEPKLLFIYFDRFSQDNHYNIEHTCNIYDMDFNQLNVQEDIPNSPEHVKKPEQWDMMKEMARTLSEPFPYCRVDLYNIDERVYFGELTFYDGGGCVSLHPEEWDRRVAGWIDINSKKVIVGQNN